MSAEDDKIAFDLDEERFGPQESDTWSDGTPIPSEPVHEPVSYRSEPSEADDDAEPDDYADPDGWKELQDRYEKHMFRNS